MSKLRVLHITFDMAIGGTEQVIRQLVLNLPTEIECQILCIDGRVGDIGLALQQQGTKVHVLPRKAGLDWQLIRNIRKLVREEGIDIVHCHQYTPWVYGWFAHWCTAAKVVFTEHGRFYPDKTRWKALPLNLIMAFSTSLITAISQSTKSALQRHEFIPGFKCTVIYNGIKGLEVSSNEVKNTRKSLSYNDDVKIIGTVARLDKIKNQIMLIKGFAKLAAINNDVRLLIVGDGPERKSLETLSEALHIKNKVDFVGFSNEPAQFFGAFDIFVLSSYTEGTAMTLLEAASLGIPCVVTNVGGNPEIILDRVNGLLVDSDNDEQLFCALKLLLEDSTLRAQLAVNARRRFDEHYSVKNMTGRFSTSYLRIKKYV